MKVALVAPSGVPFVVGGAEKLWWGLTQHVNRHTQHEMELIKLPSAERDFWEIAQSYERFSLLDLGHFDAVITTKYPAWMVKHPNHIVYLQHRLRGLYDTWPKRMPLIPPKLPDAVLPLWQLLQRPEHSRDMLPEIFERVRHLKELADDGAPWVADLTALPGALVRALVHKLDGIALSPGSIRSYWAISTVVAQRDGYFPAGVAVQVLPHPSNLEGLHAGPAEIVFTASRLDKPKRLDLLIKAYRKCRTTMPLWIAGDGPEAGHLRDLAAGDARIRLLGRLTDDELVAHYSRAALVPFVPELEDMGLITLEAMGAGKPVLTVSDAGGVTEFVEDGVNGRVVAPEVSTLAQAMDELLANPAMLAKMGEAACATASSVNWARTTQKLLEAAQQGLTAVPHIPPRSGPGPTRKRVLVLNTFGVYAPNSGGKKRVFYLYRALAEHWDVTLLNLGAPKGETEIRTFGEHYREIRVAPSDKFLQLERDLSLQLQQSVTDVAALLFGHELTAYIETFKHLARQADVVVAAHVYMWPLIERLWNGPVWYDAHNVEADMKADILGAVRLQGLGSDHPAMATALWPGGLTKEQARDHAVLMVAAAERRLVMKAERVLAVSEADRQRLARLYGRDPAQIEVTPNGTQTPADAWLDDVRRGSLKRTLGLGQRPLALFVGADHGPNFAAVDAVVNMARKCPDWCFVVAGSVCRHLERRPIPNNLFALGLVSEAELTVLLRATDVGLNPMTQGSGTNLKVLDYASHGALVLSTSVGARGLAMTPGIHHVECDVEDFVEQLHELRHQVPGPLPNLRSAARAHVELKYDWQVIADGVIER